MNFLAHLYLSGENQKIMVGNFMGDFVKGKTYRQQYDHEIVTGIELHRYIDEFTDSHAVVSQSKNRLRPKYRHYSGVIVDVFYDHFLAHNFGTFHRQPLPEFVQQCYNTITVHAPILPAELNHMMPYMISGNWLLHYSQTEGIHRALSGMAQRTSYPSKMDEAIAELNAHYDDFNTEFLTFFPQLKESCRQFLEHR